MSEAGAQNGPWSRLNLADNGVHPGNSGRWPSRSDGSRLVWRKSNHEVQTVLTVSASAQSHGRRSVVVDELRRVACVFGLQGTFLRRTGPRERERECRVSTFVHRPNSYTLGSAVCHRIRTLVVVTKMSQFEAAGANMTW